MQSNLEIQEELAEIKKQLKSQKRFVKMSVVGWVAVLSIGVMGMAYQQSNYFSELKVGRLALVDANGVERLILVNDSATVRVNGKTYPRKPVSTGILFQNEKGDEVAGFVMGKNGQIVLMLDGLSNHTPYGVSERVGLVSMPDGTAGLYLFDLKGNLRGSLTSGSKLDSKFSLADEKGNSQIEGNVSLDGITNWKTSN
jgi:hypothetical protein